MSTRSDGLRRTAVGPQVGEIEALRGDPNRRKLRQIGGEDPPGGLGRGSERFDPGMRVRTAQEGDLQRARQFDAGDKFTATMQVRLALTRSEEALTPRASFVIGRFPCDKETDVATHGEDAATGDNIKSSVIL
jgi:hypothetical protein